MGRSSILEVVALLLLGLFGWAFASSDAMSLGARAAEQLSSTASGVSSAALDIALLVAGIGIVAMAIVELFKAVLPIRPWFHYLVLDIWLRGPDRDEKWCELMRLTAGSESQSLIRKLLWLDQPASVLHTQMQAAVRIIIHTEEQSPHLCELLQINPGVDGSPQNDPHLLSVLRATRNLEMLKIRLTYWWSRANQLSAMLISTLVCFNLLGESIEGFERPQLMLVSIMGGITAPFAKDLTSRLAGITWKRS